MTANGLDEVIVFCWKPIRLSARGVTAHDSSSSESHSGPSAFAVILPRLETTPFVVIPSAAIPVTRSAASLFEWLSALIAEMP